MASSSTQELARAVALLLLVVAGVAAVGAAFGALAALARKVVRR